VTEIAPKYIPHLLPVTDLRSRIHDRGDRWCHEGKIQAATTAPKLGVLATSSGLSLNPKP